MAEEKKLILTPEGKQKLEDELNQLKNVERVKNTKEIEVARSFGDLSENAEYDAAKNEQARIEGRIRDIEEMLRNAVVVLGGKDDGIVNVGSTVLVYDIEYEEEDEYTVVGATEANPAKLFVSTESPIGRALLGHKAGETIEIQTPGGISKLEIRKVSKKH